MIYIKNIIGDNFDVDNKQFITNFDYDYCVKQYELYTENKKKKEEFIIPMLTAPLKILDQITINIINNKTKKK